MENEKSLCFTCSKCAIIKKSYLENQYRMICPYYNKVGGHSKGYDVCVDKIVNCKGYSKKGALK